MDDELIRGYRRWLEADESGAEDEADAACLAMFRSADREGPVPLGFVSRTMEAVAAEAERDARRARRTRTALVAGSILTIGTAAYFGAGAALSAAIAAVGTMFDLLIGLIVRSAAGVEAGAGMWSLLGSMGRAASAFVADPTVTFVLLVLQGLAIAALVALQRLLGSDGESFK